MQIKEILAVGMYKQAVLTRNQENFLKKVITKSFRVSAIRNMAIQAILKDELGMVFFETR